MVFRDDVCRISGSKIQLVQLLKPARPGYV
jgi:hypothetical protein